MALGKVSVSTSLRSFSSAMPLAEKVSVTSTFFLLVAAVAIAFLALLLFQFGTIAYRKRAAPSICACTAADSSDPCRCSARAGSVALRHSTDRTDHQEERP